MTETSGQPERSPWSTGDLRQAFVNDAIAARGYVVFAGEDEPEPEPQYFNASDDPAYEPPAGGRRSPRSQQAAMAAIADAMGVAVTDLDDMGIDEAMTVIDHDLADPLAAMDAVERVLADGRRDQPKAGPGESSGAYTVREGNWRERNGMPRRRNPDRVRPSRTPEARRARYIAAKAAKLGVSVAEAEAGTRRNVSFGRAKGT